MKFIIALVLLLASTALAQDIEQLQINVTVVSQSQSGAGIERRCSELGDNCVCNEPMNTATHDGGSTQWAWGSVGWGGNGAKLYDFDDTTLATKQCKNLPSQETFCTATPGVSPVSALGQLLPSAHSLTHVLKAASDVGGGICHVNHPRLTTSTVTGTTYCIRHYRRWDPSSAATDWTPAIPEPCPTPTEPNKMCTQNKQQKIMTIGGYGAIPGFLTVQISAAASLTEVPTAHSRLDGAYIGGNQTADLLPGSLQTNCTNNWCRFEMCIDHGTDGIMRSRYRMTRLTPGTPASATVNHTGTNVTTGQTWDQVGPNGDSMFALNWRQTSYNTHFIVTQHNTVQSSFWPGSACEVEGGCPP